MTGLIGTRDDDDNKTANLYGDSGADPLDEDFDEADEEEEAGGEEGDGEEEESLDPP